MDMHALVKLLSHLPLLAVALLIMVVCDTFEIELDDLISLYELYTIISGLIRR